MCIEIFCKNLKFKYLKFKCGTLQNYYTKIYQADLVNEKSIIRDIN